MKVIYNLGEAHLIIERKAFENKVSPENFQRAIYDIDSDSDRKCRENLPREWSIEEIYKFISFDTFPTLENISDPFRTDAEADADVLKSAGMGTDEDYGGDVERL